MTGDHSGLLIAFEGVDGSGLTTHAKMTVSYLNSIGLKAVYSKEPTRGPIGSLIRRLLADKSLPKNGRFSDLLALLFAADRLRHFYWPDPESRAPLADLLSEGWIVVLDRYKYSSIAYQGVYSGFRWVETVNSKVPDADIIVYLDVSIDLIFDRLAYRSRLEIYEDRQYLENIKNAFEKVLRNAESRGARIVRVKVEREGGEDPPVEIVNARIISTLCRTLEEFHFPCRPNP